MRNINRELEPKATNSLLWRQVTSFSRESKFNMIKKTIDEYKRRHMVGGADVKTGNGPNIFRSSTMQHVKTTDIMKNAPIREGIPTPLNLCSTREVCTKYNGTPMQKNAINGN